MSADVGRGGTDVGRGGAGAGRACAGRGGTDAGTPRDGRTTEPHRGGARGPAARTAAARTTAARTTAARAPAARTTAAQATAARVTAARGTAAVVAVALAAVLLGGAAGCSLPKTHHRPGTSHEEATGSVAPATEAPAGEDEGGDGDGASSGRVVEIAIADHRVSPSPGRVRLHRGQRVTLRVTSDRDDELHVHGYDREAELPAGTPVTLTFTADRTGLFEVETHKSHLVLTQLLVR